MGPRIKLMFLYACVFNIFYCNRQLVIDVVNKDIFKNKKYMFHGITGWSNLREENALEKIESIFQNGILSPNERRKKNLFVEITSKIIRGEKKTEELNYISCLDNSSSEKNYNGEDWSITFNCFQRGVSFIIDKKNLNIFKKDDLKHEDKFDYAEVRVYKNIPIENIVGMCISKKSYLYKEINKDKEKKKKLRNILNNLPVYDEYGFYIDFYKKHKTLFFLLNYVI
jgi:hypothetical protein